MGHGRTFHRWLAGAAGLVALAAALTPAQAQFFFGPPVLPQRAVIDVLREDGFRRISPPILNRDVYFLDAIDPHGDPVRLIVSAYSGEIIKAHLRARGHWQEAEPGWDSWNDPPPPPRRLAPQERPQKQASAPSPRLREPQSAPPTVRQPPARPLTTTRPAEPPKPKPPVAAAPQGSKAQPRVIPLAPGGPAAPSIAPPVAPLDDVPARQAPATPYVPPAPLE